MGRLVALHFNIRPSVSIALEIEMLICRCQRNLLRALIGKIRKSESSLLVASNHVGRLEFIRKYARGCGEISGVNEGMIMVEMMSQASKSLGCRRMIVCHGVAR